MIAARSCRLESLCAIRSEAPVFRDSFRNLNHCRETLIEMNAVIECRMLCFPCKLLRFPCRDRSDDGRRLAVLEQVDAELQGPDPGWSETLFDHRRTLVVENAFNLCCDPPGCVGGFRWAH
jgi:hypothetical protein